MFLYNARGQKMSLLFASSGFRAIGIAAAGISVVVAAADVVIAARFCSLWAVTFFNIAGRHRRWDSM